MDTGIILYPCVLTTAAHPPEREALRGVPPAALLLPWRALRRWKAARSEVSLVVTDGRPSTHTYRLRSEHAALIGCALQAHASALVGEPGLATAKAEEQAAAELQWVASATIDRI